MESALTARDRVGVQDFVLLENFTSETAFIENLRKRSSERLIYVSRKFPLFNVHTVLKRTLAVQTYIGSVLVSVNPYRPLNIYTPYHQEKYQGVNFYEMPPHV